jgi:hypothetical protein
VVTCGVLITSRFSGNLSGVRRRELALFDTEESREYVRTHLQPRLLAKARGHAVLDAVAEEVDHLPLALEVVVSYMHETNQSATEWLEEWHKAPDATIKHYDSDNVIIRSRWLAFGSKASAASRAARVNLCIGWCAQAKAELGQAIAGQQKAEQDEQRQNPHFLHDTLPARYPSHL